MTIPLSVRLAILERDSFRCRYCGKRAVETELEVDHIRPRSRGGEDDAQNLTTTCRDCNRGKGDRVIEPPGEWTRLVGKYFHVLCAGGLVQKQGRIVEEVMGGVYVVDYFSWITGYAGAGKQLAALQQMLTEKWRLYQDADAMREALEIGEVRGHEQADECACGYKSFRSGEPSA